MEWRCVDDEQAEWIPLSRYLRRSGQMIDQSGGRDGAPLHEGESPSCCCTMSSRSRGRLCQSQERLQPWRVTRIATRLSRNTQEILEPRGEALRRLDRVGMNRPMHLPGDAPTPGGRWA